MSSSEYSATRRRTQRAIQETFLALLREKDLSKMTVQDVCTRAEVNRATFYRYYPDLYALRDDICDMVFDQLFDTTRSSWDRSGVPRGSAVPFFYEALDYTKAHQSMFQVLLSNEIRDRFSARLVNATLQALRESASSESIYRPEWDASLSFLVHGMIGVFCDWVSDGCATPTESLSQLMDYMFRETYAYMEKQK